MRADVRCGDHFEADREYPERLHMKLDRVAVCACAGGERKARVAAEAELAVRAGEHCRTLAADADIRGGERDRTHAHGVLELHAQLITRDRRPPDQAHRRATPTGSGPPRAEAPPPRPVPSLRRTR